MHPDNVDTGAVILTGEALRRENAQGDRRRARGGRRRVRVRRRRAPHGVDARRLRLGRGEGLARRAACRSSTSTSAAAPPSSRSSRRGKVVHTAAIHLGGRLAVVDADGRLTRLDPGGQAPRRAGRVRLDASGDTVSEDDLDRVACVDGRRARRGAHAGSGAARRRRAVADGAARRHRRHRRARCSRAASANTSTAARSAISAISAAASGARSASGSTRAAAVSAAAGRRVHPRHGARRLRVQRAAVGQHRLHLEPGRAAAAQEPAGDPAAR